MDEPGRRLGIQPCHPVMTFSRDQNEVNGMYEIGERKPESDRLDEEKWQ
jgi:hypothetical protein